MKQYPSKTIKAITEFLFIGEEKNALQHSDLVLVLGNNMIDGTMEEVRDLYDCGIISPSAKIILSGANGSLNAGQEKEAHQLYHSGVEKFHMPGELFVLEDRATNAYENFLFSKEVIDGLGGFSQFRNILVIGKAFLLRRASMYAAKTAYPIEKIQYYGTVDVQGRNIGANCWWKSDYAAERVYAEIERIGKYARSGDLSIW